MNQKKKPDDRPRLVIDTNIFIANFFGKTSRKVVDLWRNEEAVLLASKPILGEYFEIISRFKFHRSLEPLLDLFRREFNMEIIRVKGRKRLVPGDAEDDKFLHCALEGDAMALITSDEHLLDIKRFYKEELPICTAPEFMKKVWKG